MPLSESANLCVDDTKESGKAFWTLVNFNSSPAVISLSFHFYSRHPCGQRHFFARIRSTECYGLCKTAANLPDAVQQSRLFRLCRVWLRPGLTGMLVRCMLRGTRFVVSAPMHKRKHSPTQLPDHLGYRLHRECNAVPSGTFVSGKLSRCPPPAAWRLSHWVAECAGVRTHSDRRYLSRCSKTGAARHQVHQYIGVTLSSLCLSN